MHPDEIVELISQALPGATVHVWDQTGGGDHFEVLVVWPEFAGKSLVERHQQVYGAVSKPLAGSIHALSLRTYTPDEAAANEVG